MHRYERLALSSSQRAVNWKTPETGNPKKNARNNQPQKQARKPTQGRKPYTVTRIL
jgi:hypothetical protein